jgi:hypothetical protein
MKAENQEKQYRLSTTYPQSCSMPIAASDLPKNAIQTARINSTRILLRAPEKSTQISFFLPCRPEMVSSKRAASLGARSFASISSSRQAALIVFPKPFPVDRSENCLDRDGSVRINLFECGCVFAIIPTLYSALVVPSVKRRDDLE